MSIYDDDGGIAKGDRRRTYIKKLHTPNNFGLLVQEIN